MFELDYDFSKTNKHEYENISKRASNVLNLRRPVLPRSILSLYQRKSISNRSSLQESAENTAFYQVASLIPDEVLLNSNDYNTRQFQTSVLFADISGFTDLSENYQNLENGASKLSTVLNFYLGIMVQEILSHNGDIIKYAGDAFIAIFHNDAQMSIQNSTHNAIDTSIIIQKHCRNFHTEVGVTLNVKIAISCGELDFQLVGDENSSHYVIIGDPVWQVKSLQEFISPGEILLSRKAWHYIQESQYIYEIMKDHHCYKIIGFKEQVNLIQRQYEATLNFQELQKNLTKSIEANSVSNILLETGFDPEISSFPLKQNEIFSLRQKIHLITSNEVRKNLRRFVITPLLNAIDMGDCIESLTEMRNIVTVFANFVVSNKNSIQILSITNDIYKKLYSIVNAYEGVLNKVLLFDKDMMFLSIFGLRGLQHENESEIGLRCAKELHDVFSKWNQISNVSIGVTTGKGYCGVVGHSLRREYSVIGVTVNRAARLMIAYPNIVSCDKETLIESKINLKHFNNLPKKFLKGISDQIAVYEFSGIVEKYNLDLIENDILHGRQELMYEIKRNLVNAIMKFNYGHKTNNDISCFILKGENGEGKSKVVNYFYRDILMNSGIIKSIRLLLNTKHSTMPFWMLKYCFKRIIEIEYNDDMDTFMNTVSKKFQHFNIQKYLFLLNEIIGTSYDENNVDLNDEDRIEIQKLMIIILCKNLKNFWVILIDDADYIDLCSLKFINSIITSQTIFIILSIGKNHKKWTLQQGKFIKNEHVTQHNLKPIDKTFEKDIACQSINVLAIPIEFERFIHKHSNGNAGWIETCAKTLLYSGKLKIKTLSYSQAVNNGMIMKNEPTNNEHDDFFRIKSLHTVNDLRQHDKVINVAVIEGVLCEKDYMMGYKNSKLMVYDTLSSYDQMICKCASVIGQKFLRNQLNYVITKADYRLVGKTILKLFQLNILFCASQRFNENETISCACNNIEIFESCRDLPKYASCSYLTFNDENFRKYVYDTLTERQRIEYHQKCINYLCRTTKKCNVCNYERFEFIEEIKLNFRDGYTKSDCIEFEMKEKLLRRNSIVHTSNQHDEASRKQCIILNYMNYEYRNCKCNFLLNHAFNEIVGHCQGNDMIMKKIFSQIAFADVSIKTGNIPNAMQFLNFALKQLSDSLDYFDNNVLLLTYMRGKAMILLGTCFEAIGQNYKALDSYYKACDIFKISFPKKLNLMARLKLFGLIARINYLMNRRNRTTTLTRIQMMVVHQSSILLQNFCNCFIKVGNKELAILAAIWSLNEALQSHSDIGTLAKCFTNILKSGAYSYIKSFERKFFNEIFKLTLCQNIDKESLEQIIELYITVLEQQVYRQNINFSVNIGELAKKMCYNMGNHEALLNVIPSLFILYLKTFCIENCYKLLQELHYSIKFNNNNENAEIWFYALCMDLFLDTRIDCIVEYDECKVIYIECITNQAVERYSDAYSRFIINFMLWRARISQLYELQQLEYEVIKKISLNTSTNFNQIFTFLRLNQFVSLHFRKEKLNGNVENFFKLRGFIKKYVKQSPIYKYIKK